MGIKTKVLYINYIDHQEIQNAPSFHIFPSIKPGKLKSLSLASQALHAITCLKYEHMLLVFQTKFISFYFLLETFENLAGLLRVTFAFKNRPYFQATMKVNSCDKPRIPTCMNWHTLRSEPTFALTSSLSLTSKSGERKLQDIKGNWAFQKLILQLLSLEHYLPSPKGIIYTVRCRHTDK